MDHTTLYILMLVAFCSTAHIPEENKNNTSVSDEHIGDCVVDNVTYTNGANVPSPGPCEECHCQSSEVVCAMIKCKPNTSGCKVIQQANHCCPQYKCECEFNGRLYNNGERLERPDDPCWVCYCKGGEVMCTSITCYERNDCTPHFVPGQCCPKYDHCPIENPNTLRSHGGNTNSTNLSGKREMQPWLLTVSVNSQTTPSTATNTETPSPNRYPQTIKIIEILPTQLPPLQKEGTKKTVGPMIPNKNDGHFELVSAETPTDSQVNSDTTTPFVSRFSASTLKEDKEEAENNEGNLGSTVSPDENDISTSGVSSFEDKVKENITDIIDESSTIINEADRESITAINNVSETNTAEGHLTTISQSSTTEQHLTTQIDLRNKEREDEADKVIIHSLENKELSNENERSALYNDQSAAMTEELLTMNTNYGRFPTTYEDSSENSASIENTTSEVEEEYTSPSEKSFTSESDSEYKHLVENAANTSGDSVFNSVSQTKYTMVPEYVLFGQMRDQESKSNNNTFNRNNDVNLVNSPYTEYYDLSTKQNAQQNNDNVSPEIQPDSERYTTILPEKFDANLIEFNTENYYVDSTEGSGFDLINGWTYVDPTSEVYNEELSHTNQAQSSTGEFSSENVSLNEINSTPSVDEGNLNTFENLPTQQPSEVTDTGSSESTDQSTSNDETSSVSAEYMTDFNDNIKKTTIAFPSILKLNNQIQFLKIEDKQTTDKENTPPIAKIGIYNPNNPNNMANLVTVVQENNAELEQQINNDKIMAKQEENYTPHILLTPNDLKTLAEILIHEKIIPPFLQNEVRSTNNIIEQRSIEQEIVTSETESEETTAASTTNEKDEEEEIGTYTLGNDTSYNDLVEIINVNNISSKASDELAIRETSSPMAPTNLTDLEVWAQNILDKVTSNILVPLTGVEFVDSNTTTTESNFSEENVTTINDISSNDNVTISGESDEDFTESSVNDITTETISESSTDSVLNQSSEDSSEEEHSGDSEIKQIEEKNREEEESEDKIKQTVQDVNTSRQSRIPSKLISPLLSTSMLDDRDLILLHNFFKKNLSSK